MFGLANGCRHTVRSALSRPRTPVWTIRHASRISIATPPPFPVTDSCPAPSCACKPMPDGLDIDTNTPIAGLSPVYAEQVLISTGNSGWKSRIEDDESAWLLRSLKSHLGRGGKYSDPFHNVLLTHSSLPPSTDAAASAFLLPSFTYLPSITPSDVEPLIQSHILPVSLPPSHPAPSPHLLRQPTSPLSSRPVSEILILICGHSARDSRCGTLAPILTTEFASHLSKQGVRVLTDPGADDGAGPAARIASISHIGGHKFAGNVIVYLPLGHGGALAGTGLWYRRVRPEHVEGIVGETVLGGRVIRELFAGGVRQGGEVLRL